MSRRVTALENGGDRSEKRSPQLATAAATPLYPARTPRHPNLVTLLDAGVDRSEPGQARIFYVMELVNGTDLKRKLDSGPLGNRQVAQIGYWVASALEYVHGRGIVHRGVKPANVLIKVGDDGSTVEAQLGDFGIASIGNARPITDAEYVTGTVAYSSPEQARGGEVGPASDVYSLGTACGSRHGTTLT